MWVITLCALISSLVSCDKTADNLNLEQTPAPVEASTPTVIQGSPTVMPEMFPTGTPTITASPTSVVESATPVHTELVTHCIEVTAETPAMYQSSGYLVLWGLMQARPVVIDMSTGEQIALSDGWNFLDWSISPDEAWIIYEEGIFENNVLLQVKLNLMSPDGAVVSTMSLEPGMVFEGWLDQERLMVSIPYDPTFVLYSLRTINPFTSEQEDIPFDFPDVYQYSPPPIGFSPVSAYDPTLTRLVYAVEKPDRSVGYSLWDVEDHQEILFIDGPSWYPPKWSPDGSRFIVATYVGDSTDPPIELAVIDRDGTIEQITDLHTYYPRTIGEYSWSPDGTQVAFWFSGTWWQDAYEELMVLDISTGVITNYCVQGRARLKSTNAPVWSPDSTQIAIQSYAYGSDNQVIMVDIVQGHALQLTESRDALWWLRTFPDVWASP
jgi:hypothetical protein